MELVSEALFRYYEFCTIMLDVAEWRNWFGKHSSNIMNFVPLCLMWLLWKEQINHTFEDTDSSKN